MNASSPFSISSASPSCLASSSGSCYSTQASRALLPDQPHTATHVECAAGTNPAQLPLTTPSTNTTSPVPLFSMQPSGDVESSSRTPEQHGPPLPSASVHAAALATGHARSSPRSSSSLLTCTTTPSAGAAHDACTPPASTPQPAPAPATVTTSPSAHVAPPAPSAASAAGPPQLVAQSTGAAARHEVEEVHSCVTLSSTASSRETSPTTGAAQPLLPGTAPADARARPHLLTSSPSTDALACEPRGVEGLQDAENAMPVLSCASSDPGCVTLMTPPVVADDERRSGPALASPSPSKPSPAARTPVAVAKAAAAAARPYALLDSESGGRPTADPPPAEVKVQQPPLLDASGLARALTTALAPPSATTAASVVAHLAAPAVAQPAPQPVLSSEQHYAFQLVVRERRNVFITGGAGTGKSHLLRTIIAAMPASSTFVTATTGIAALNLSGTTLHSFVGCGIPNRKSTRESLLHMVRFKQRCLRGWRACRSLIIDEVSMLDADYFELVDYIARHVRNRPDEPFGGIQLILSGDFLQLPPVSRERPGANPTFCFETETWLKINPRICLLSTPFRQRDLRFFAILNEMRFGELQPESVELLYSMDTTERVHFVRRTTVKPEHGDPSTAVARIGLKREAEATAEGTAQGMASAKTEEAGGMRQTRLELINGLGRPIDAPFDGYTILRSTRAEVDAENQRYYRQLETEVFAYRGAHTGRGDFPETSLNKLVHLRKGCRVMLIKNLDPRVGLVNGSTGTLTDFVSCGKGYVFKTQNVTMQDVRSVCVGRGSNPETQHTMLPVVAFELRAADGTVRTRELVVEPQEWKEMLGDREISRSVQMPLILAYAITIHKSQGMSLTHVDIDFKRVFEAGQSYVALSRCTDMVHVRLHGFDAHRVSTNATALAYYKALSLQQERLRWRRSHVPQRVAAEEAREAFSCNPYGYVLGNEARALRHRGNEDLPTGFSSASSDPSSASSSASTCSTASSLTSASSGSGSRAARRHRHRHRRVNEEKEETWVAPEAANGGVRTRSRHADRRGGRRDSWHRTSHHHHHHHRDRREWSSSRPAWTVRRHARRPRGDSADGLALEDEWGEGAEDGASATERLDRLRKRITPLLAMAAMVKRLVTRQVMPLHRVCNSRIVVDVNALFQLVTGPESAAAFDVLFGEHDNMMRVPLCVHTLVTEVAAYRSASASVSQGASPLQTSSLDDAGSRPGPDDEPTASTATGAAPTQPPDAPLLAASSVAAEALAVMERAKQDFILDVQRPEQTCPLPSPDAGWIRFADILALLRHASPKTEAKAKHVPPTRAAAAAAAAVEEEENEADACREVDFILNRDPREVRHHRAILEYALFLQSSFGQDVVICTDSVLLAACAFAWRLRVVSIDYLCSGSTAA